MIVRQCAPDYPACWLVGQFTVPDDGTWRFDLLNRADGPTLLDVYRDGVWSGGHAAWVTTDTLPYTSTPTELPGTTVQLEPVAIPAPQSLIFDSDTGVQPPTTRIDSGSMANADHDRADGTNSSALRGGLPWFFGALVSLGLVGTVLSVVRRRRAGARRVN